jgi:hypothetical protein
VTPSLKTSTLRNVLTFASYDFINAGRRETMAIHSDYFFDNPDAILLATSLNFQRNWLNLYEAAILESIQMTQAVSIRRTKPLSAYFPITKAGVRPEAKFDKRLKTRHKGPRRRKPKVNPASLSAHRLSYFSPRPLSRTTVPTPTPQPIQQRNSSQHLITAKEHPSSQPLRMHSPLAEPSAAQQTLGGLQ